MIIFRMIKRCYDVVKSMENYCCVLLSNYYDDVNKTKITIYLRKKANHGG